MCYGDTGTGGQAITYPGKAIKDATYVLDGKKLGKNSFKIRKDRIYSTKKVLWSIYVKNNT